MTVLIVVAILIVYAPIHAYGMGRYQRWWIALYDAKFRHYPDCNVSKKHAAQYGHLGCDCGGHTPMRFASVFWPLSWPMGAAIRAGRTKRKPILTPVPDEVAKAFEDLERELSTEPALDPRGNDADGPTVTTE